MRCKPHCTDRSFTLHPSCVGDGWTLECVPVQVVGRRQLFLRDQKQEKQSDRKMC